METLPSGILKSETAERLLLTVPPPRKVAIGFIVGGFAGVVFSIFLGVETEFDFRSIFITVAAGSLILMGLLMFFFRVELSIESNMLMAKNVPSFGKKTAQFDIDQVVSIYLKKTEQKVGSGQTRAKVVVPNLYIVLKTRPDAMLMSANSYAQAEDIGHELCRRLGLDSEGIDNPREIWE